MKRSVKTVLKRGRKFIVAGYKKYENCDFDDCSLFGMNRTFFPVSCVWVALTGFPCPGCGLTRAALALLKGNFKEAFQIHPFIYVIAVIRTFILRLSIYIKKKPKSFCKYVLIVLIAMLCFYVYRMVFVFPGEPPMSLLPHNFISTFFR